MRATNPLRIASSCALALGLFAQTFTGISFAMEQGLSESLIINPSDFSAQDAALTIRYKIECLSDRYQMVPGELSYEGRKIRFDLFSARTESSILVSKPAASSTATISLVSGTDCSAKILSAQIEPLASQAQQSDAALAQLAMMHAPYLNVRSDQVENRLTDLPLVMAYSVMPSQIEGNKKIRYTLFFTDEDSKTTVAGTDFQMARYGRRTDIEWIYEVELDQNNNVVQRLIQGALIKKGLFGGAGHATASFHGDFLDGQHPVLYNIADHNVFSDRPIKNDSKLPFVGYQLVPSERIDLFDAREIVMARNPWMYKVSDIELAREGKLGSPSSQYLYVSVAGKLRGSVNAVVVLDDNRIELTGNEGHGNLDRLGEDLWGKQAFVAVPMSEALLEKIEHSGVHGAVYFADAAEKPTEVQVSTFTVFQPSELKFIRIKAVGSNGYRYQDISSKFNCRYLNLESVCRF